ncbi:hypothetical protein ACFU0X_10295 [Streptomyces cellulosae]|uniref:Uncharacterized protein n=1 Tax=Streptomyces cellulosae TaxID=1968 RepID=A0ABW6JDI7_STRCE
MRSRAFGLLAAAAAAILAALGATPTATAAPQHTVTLAPATFAPCGCYNDCNYGCPDCVCPLYCDPKYACPDDYPCPLPAPIPTHHDHGHHGHGHHGDDISRWLPHGNTYTYKVNL